MKIFYILLLLLSFCFISCEKEAADNPQLPLKEAITGDWLVTYQKLKSTNFTFEDRHEGVVTKWGCYYILSLKINADGTYIVNNADAAATPGTENSHMGGTWSLDEHNSVSFSCGTDHSHTHFKAFISKDGRLVLENDKMILRHHKIK